MAETPYESVPQFDYLRKKLQGQASQKRSEAQDAIQRRFAAQGMLQSGAYQKTIEQSDEALNKEVTEGNEAINQQEQQELQRRRETQEARDFAKGEREASQTFAKGEREAGQGFAAGESKLSREQALDLFSKDMAFKEKVNKQDWDKFTATQNLAERDFAESQRANYINTVLGAEGDPNKLRFINDQLSSAGFDVGTAHGAEKEKYNKTYEYLRGKGLGDNDAQKWARKKLGWEGLDIFGFEKGSLDEIPNF